jgi:hypothetical protein
MTPPLPIPRPLPSVTPVVPAPLICASATSHVTVRANIVITLVRTKFGGFIAVAGGCLQAKAHYAGKGDARLYLMIA